MTPRSRRAVTPVHNSAPSRSACTIPGRRMTWELVVDLEVGAVAARPSARASSLR